MSHQKTPVSPTRMAWEESGLENVEMFSLKGCNKT